MQCVYTCISKCIFPICGPGSSVGIATDWTVRGSNPGGARFSAIQTGPGALPASCTMGTGSFPGVKCGRGMLLTPHPLLAPRSLKSRAIPLPTLWATTGPVTGTLYLLYGHILVPRFCAVDRTSPQMVGCNVRFSQQCC